MLTTPSETIAISEIYDVSPEEVLFLDFSLKGVNFSAPYVRVRFEFFPENKPYFKTSRERNVDKYFFALPTAHGSIYRVGNGYMAMGGEIIGMTGKVEEDTCDSSYFRRKGTALNLNPVSKSSCYGCKFCHTAQQTPRDKESLISEPEARDFLKKLIRRYNLSDLSHLIQVAVVTGCFGGEQKVIDYLKMIRAVLRDYGFNGVLFYYGSEINTEEAMDQLQEVKPFALCLSIECFTDRDIMLKSTKSRITIEDAKNILARAKQNGFQSSFSYILGIEPLRIMELNFEAFIPFINVFPTVNIFQVHQGQRDLRIPSAWELDYYLRAREILENMFMDTDMRPKPWENYRGLWHLNFGKEELDNARTPS